MTTSQEPKLRRTRVAICTTDDSEGFAGPHAWLLRLAPLLRERNIELHVLCLTTGYGPFAVVDGLREQGIRVDVTERPHFTADRVRWILKTLQNDPPDVFIPNMVLAAYFASRWVKEAGIPTVGVLHSDDAYHQAIFSDFIAGDPIWRLSSLVCVSKAQEELLAPKLPNDIQITTIPYGAPVPDEPTSPPDSTMRLIYAGRLVEEQKQASATALGMCRAVAEVPDTEAVIFGAGPAKGDVERVVQTHAAMLPVKVMGRIGTDVLRTEFLRSHVFVLLSNYEGLPIALMEAMAAGVVPICTRMRSGIPELVEHEVTGLLVDDREDSFVDAVRQLRTDRELWSHLSQAARAKIIHSYSSEVGADRWAKHIDKVAAGAAQRVRIVVHAKLELPDLHQMFASQDIRLTTPDKWLIATIAAAGRRVKRAASDMKKTGKLPIA